MANETAGAAAQAAFEAARRRRAALGALSIEEKVLVLVALQRLASSVVSAAGRPARLPWQIEAPRGALGRTGPSR